MKIEFGRIRLSASDLSNHLACHHLTQLDLSVTAGKRAAPSWKAPDLWVLQQRGFEHESAYLRHLHDIGLEVVSLDGLGSDDAAISATRAAMGSGADVIAQATMANEHWFGRSDILRRVGRPSLLGEWSYEVYDCKLARETKAATILQLSLYSELLASIQGVLPENMYVVPPVPTFQPESTASWILLPTIDPLNVDWIKPYRTPLIFIQSQRAGMALSRNPTTYPKGQLLGAAAFG